MTTYVQLSNDVTAGIEYFYPSAIDHELAGKIDNDDTDINAQDRYVAASVRRITFRQDVYAKRAFWITGEDLEIINAQIEAIPEHRYTAEEVLEATKYYVTAPF